MIADRLINPIVCLQGGVWPVQQPGPQGEGQPGGGPGARGHPRRPPAPVRTHRPR